MNKIRKVLTIFAVIGTILVTALFCYMPVREALREYRKHEISLAQETLFQTESKEEVAKQEEFDQPVQMEAEKIGHEIPEVVLTVKSTKQGTHQGHTQVTLWQTDSGDCYFFLPGFAKSSQLSLSKTVPDEGLLSIAAGSIQIGNTRIHQGDTLKDIQWGQAYDMTVYDSNDSVILTAPVSFICSSALPVLELTTQSGSMDYIHEVKGNEESGTLTLLDAEGNTLFSEEMESLSGRGNSTWGLAKKPYQFKLKKEIDLIHAGKSADYALLANGYDETGLRNQLAMEMATQLGMSYVPEGQMVDVYLNGNYYGNYYLCEKVQVDSERVDIFDLEETTRALYQSQEIDKLTAAENENGTRKWVDIEYEEEDITGGYLIERELESRYYEEMSGFVTDQKDYYAIKSPTHASRAQVDYIATKMQEFQDAVQQKDGIHPVTGRHYTEYIDMDSFVRKYLVEEVTKNYDGGVTSSFFYKPQDLVSTKLFAGPVWDYDIAFGNCNMDEIVSNPLGITRLNNHIYGTDVFTCLYAKDEFYTRTVELYQKEVLPYLNYLLEVRIDELVAGSCESVQMDSLRWEHLENRYQYYDNYDNSVRYLKYFIEKRRDFLNEVWLEGIVYHNVNFKIDGENWQILCVKDGEVPGREPIPTRNDFLFVCWVTETRGVSYDQFKPVYEDMTFHAVWQKLSLEQSEEEVPEAATSQDV